MAKQVVDFGQVNFNSEEEVKGLFRFIKGELIKDAKEALDEELKANRFTTDYITLVDGKKTTNLELVKPFGKIEFIAKSDIGIVLIQTYEKILQLSKVVTGGYLSMNYVYYNKTLIATNMNELLNFIQKVGILPQTTDTVSFVNFAPYAARLERLNVSRGSTGLVQRIKKSTDKKKRSGFFIRKPHGTYVLAAKSIKAKYGKFTKVKFSMLPGNYITNSVPLMNWKTQDKWRNTYDPKGQYNSGYYLYPVITISLGGDGLRQGRVLQ